MKKFLEYIPVIIISLLIGLSINHFVGGLVTVDGSSMDPTLHNGEKVFQLKIEKPKRNDVIVFDANGVDPQVTSKKDYVKRIIGVPGDTIKYTDDGTLYVNGKVVPQNYLSNNERITGTLKTATYDYSNTGFTLSYLSSTQNWMKQTTSDVVPKGYYFVMGDHRSVSNDGRYWGLVPKNKVAGVVHTFFWQNDLSN